MPDGLRLEVVHRSSLGADRHTAIIELCSDALKVDCRDLFGFLPADSRHVLATMDGRLIGHACWATRQFRVDDDEPLETAWIDTVVVAPKAQRLGVGSAVMRHVAELTAGIELRALGTEQMPFFERLGWERWLGSTAGVLHDPLDTLMVLRTKTTPPLDTARPIAAVD